MEWLSGTAEQVMEKGQGESEGPSLESEQKDGMLQEIRSLGEEVGRWQHDSH